MHAARLSSSSRLKRVHTLLADHKERSTVQIIQAAQVCAVNSIIAELRANGAEIVCRQWVDPATGQRLWLYQMRQPAPMPEVVA